MATEETLKENLVRFAQASSIEVRQIRQLVNGNRLSLSELNTQDKSNLVAAINELLDTVDRGVSLEQIDVAVNDYFVMHPQSFVYEQIEPSNSWLITHPLDHLPEVNVLDSAGTRYKGQVTYPAPNQVRVDFNISFPGKAILT